MPFWLTILIGLGGSAVGGGLAAAIIRPGGTITNDEYFWITLGSVAAATLLVAAYRRFVQGRPISGPKQGASPHEASGSLA